MCWGTQLNTERYRSGHNEAVLKTVCPQGRVGSNPTLSVRFISKKIKWIKYGLRMKIHIVNLIFFFYKEKLRVIRRSTQAGRRDTPGKGAGR